MASTQVSSGSNGPRTITPTLEELKALSYDTLNIEAVLEALSQDGFVVLKKVVDVAHVDHLNSFMAKRGRRPGEEQREAFQPRSRLYVQ